MKKSIRLFFFLMLAFSIPSYATLITFQVDMAGETVSPNGLHLIANFNGFSPSAHPLNESSPGSNLYTLTLDLAEGDNIEYKYINGNSYDTGTVEVPPTTCAFEINNNRSFTVPTSNTSLDIHPFNGCTAGYQMITVDFCVDMAGQNTADGVFLIGEFYGGFGSFLPLSLAPGQSTVFCVSYDIPQDVTRLNYKFTIGNNYSMAESIVGACAENTDRFFFLTGANPDETALYFFNTCDLSSVLPVELKSFEVIATKSEVAIVWETYSESYTDYFLLETSSDGRNFRALHQADAAGNSQENRRYSFLDKHPSPGSNYYRLSTYNWDGSMQIEGLRRVEIINDNSGLGAIYPNPSDDYLDVKFKISSEAKTLSLLDVYGRVLQTISVLPYSAEIRIDNLDDFTPGVYYLHLQSGAEVETKSFIKK